MIEIIVFIIFMCILIGSVSGRMFNLVPFILLMVVILFFSFGLKILGIITLGLH